MPYWRWIILFLLGILESLATSLFHPIKETPEHFDLKNRQ